jgi:hypothetical protein
MSVLVIQGLADGWVRFDDGSGSKLLPTAAVLAEPGTVDTSGVSAPVLRALRTYLAEVTA